MARCLRWARPALWRLCKHSGAATMAKSILTYRGAVYPWHCDHMGHMNVMWYVGKFDEGTWNLFSAVGFTQELMRANNSSTAGVEQNISYKKELLPGDTITIYTTVLEVRDRVVRLQHEMHKNDSNELAAVMALTAVHLDGASRRATAFPAPVKEKLVALCGSEI